MQSIKRQSSIDAEAEDSGYGCPSDRRNQIVHCIGHAPLVEVAMLPVQVPQKGGSNRVAVERGEAHQHAPRSRKMVSRR